MALARFYLSLSTNRQQLQQDNIQSAAFWFEDAANYACAMLACFDAKTRILLPPNLLDENQEWIRDNADMYLMTINSTLTAFHKWLIKKISSLINIVKLKFG